jgi:hypothetical protein
LLNPAKATIKTGSDEKALRFPGGQNYGVTDFDSASAAFTLSI